VHGVPVTATGTVGAGSGHGMRKVLQVTQVRFSQASIYPTLVDGTPLLELYNSLVIEGWRDDLKPPRVVRVATRGGPVFVAYDNRRSVALRWLSAAGLVGGVHFLVYDAGEPLLEESREEDVSLRNAKFGADLSEEELRAAADAAGLPLERLASQQGFRAGDRPSTWGDLLLARTSQQQKWGAPDFPLLGRLQMPWVKWDLLTPYREHCRRLSELPQGHPVVYFKPPRSMFDRRTKASLDDFFRTMPEDAGKVAITGDTLSFDVEWQRFLDNLHRWCDDVLEGCVLCSGHTWQPACIALGAAAEGSARIRGLGLHFEEASVSMAVSLAWQGREPEELIVRVAERALAPCRSGEQQERRKSPRGYFTSTCSLCFAGLWSMARSSVRAVAQHECSRLPRET